MGLPSELLKRRPDIREAHFNMLRAAAQAGQARSARFPSISLTAKGGVASNSIKGLTAANPWAWDALGSVAEPIFGFGKLRNAERAAMAAYTQSAKSYEQTVLDGLADVEKGAGGHHDLPRPDRAGRGGRSRTTRVATMRPGALYPQRTVGLPRCDRRRGASTRLQMGW